jgi:hypothetical protein
MVLVKVECIMDRCILRSNIPRPPPPLLSRPLRVVSLPLDMEVTSQVGKDAREAIEDNLNSSLIGIDVGLNQKRV